MSARPSVRGEIMRAVHGDERVIIYQPNKAECSAWQLLANMRCPPQQRSPFATKKEKKSFLEIIGEPGVRVTSTCDDSVYFPVIMEFGSGSVARL